MMPSGKCRMSSVSSHLFPEDNPMFFLQYPIFTDLARRVPTYILHKIIFGHLTVSFIFIQINIMDSYFMC